MLYMMYDIYIYTFITYILYMIKSCSKVYWTSILII